MTVERFSVRSVTPYGDGLAGPDGRPFESVVAVATVSLDPQASEHAFVVDLAHAPPDEDGLVRLETDVVLVRPVGAGRAPSGGALLFVVANRGLVTALPFSTGVPLLAVPDGEVAAGDGWALRRGLSVAWVGWQWDVERRPGVVGIDVPEAVGDDGRPLLSQARLEFQPLAPQTHRRLADDAGPWMGPFHSLAAADTAEPTARLTVRDWFNGPRQTIERSRWRFARDVDGSPVADDEHVWLEGGFEARRLYEVVYTTRRCPVAGAGLAAVREVVPHLRAELGAGRVLAFGASQSGRWLRQFVHDTANTGPDGGRVFDGVLCHIAGGRRGEFNQRSAQPSTMNALGFTHLPPFSPETGLFAAARSRRNAPLAIFANTATEYWRGDASLVHTDEKGVDLPEGAAWRAYLYAGAHHAAGLPDDYTTALPVQWGPNRVQVAWVSRAHLAALDEWVRAGTPPPPSEVPRAADGTGVAREEVLATLATRRRFAGVQWPDPGALLAMAPLDLGPDAGRGIGRYPATVVGPSWPSLVAAVDGDGNERGGVRLPEVAVPLATSFGWNPELPRPDPVDPAHHHPVELWNLIGGAVDFEAAEVLRRYGDRERYLSLAAACVDDLVTRRHLLAEDAPAVLAHVAALWERVVPGPRGAGAMP